MDDELDYSDLPEYDDVVDSNRNDQSDDDDDSQPKVP